jgi:hypothetical protein
MSGGTLQLMRTFSKTGETTETSIIAQFIDQTNTKCETGGTFKLPDTGDKFTITAGPSDNGTITVASGSISVTYGGGATYNATTGAWTAPTAGGTIVVSRSGSIAAAGSWTSAKATAKVAITTDADGDASVSSGAYILTVTATVQQQSEARVYEIVPRPSA